MDRNIRSEAPDSSWADAQLDALLAVYTDRLGPLAGPLCAVQDLCAGLESTLEHRTSLGGPELAGLVRYLDAVQDEAVRRLA